MSQELQIKLFESIKVRTVWDSDQEKWYFSIVDIIAILTDSTDYQQSRKYWNKLKQRLREEGNEPVTNCHQLKMIASDGKMRLTDVADTTQIFRIIQSVPSKKAEPIKQWLAQVGAERLEQLQDPELSINQAIADYRRLGYAESWINQRIKTIEVRKKLTDEWKERGMDEHDHYALLTNLMYKTWSGLTKREYMELKGLKKENLRDNMTDLELLLNALAEASATELSKKQHPEGLIENAKVAQRGATIAKNAREDLETQLGESVISSTKAIDITNPADQLPFPKEKK